jgi:hypothetical protein
MRITWEQTGKEFPVRWDSNCVRRSDNGPMWFGQITDRAPYDGFRLEVWRASHGTCHSEQCATLAEAKARGAEVLRALCGGPALKSATVWCAVTPRGRVILNTCWPTTDVPWSFIVDDFFPDDNGNIENAARAGYTVRKFRIEEVR